MNIIRLGTRKSALAQAQAHWVANRLKSFSSDLQVELVLITTSGDKLTDGKASGDGGLKALFTKEIEDALLDHRIDLAVHSLKDMAAELPKGLQIGAVPEREDPRDVWISKGSVPFKRIPTGAKVGTGSVRRQAQLKRARPDIELISMRGNVDTRLRKLKTDHLDGIVLAHAGLKRLGKEKVVTDILPTEILLPAIGQGCLAIESRLGDANLNPFLQKLDHPPSHQAALAERALLRGLGGSCQTPIAGLATLSHQELRLQGLVVSEDGREAVRDELSGPVFEAESMGEKLAAMLLKAGADKILKA